MAAGLMYFYLFAGRIMKNNPAALLFMLAAAVSPNFVRSTLYDFHFAVVYFPAFFMFMYYAEKGSFWASVAAMAAAIAAREDLAVYMIFAALFVYFRKKDLKYLWMAFICFAYAAVVLMIIVPVYNPYNSGGLAESLAGKFIDPGKFLNPDMLMQFFVFAFGMLFIPFLPSGAMLFLMLPAVLVYTGAFKPSVPLFQWHYAAIVLPGVFTALVFNLESGWLKKKMEKIFPSIDYKIFTAALILLIQAQLHFSVMPVKNFTIMVLFYCFLVFALPVLLANISIGVPVRFLIAVSAVVYIYSCGYMKYYEFRGSLVSNEKRKSIYEAVKLLPDDLEIPVFSNSNIVPHIACRRYINYISTGAESMNFMSRISGHAFNRFYLLVDVDSYAYYEQSPRVRNTGINMFAVKTATFRVLFTWKAMSIC
jgi:uncharacterized membrane protein